MKKGCLLLCCLFLPFLFALAQQKGKVVGMVRDAESRETLLGVAIYEQNLKMGVTTNEKGRFEILLPFGKHQLQFSFLGYQTQTKTVVVGTDPVSLEIKLQPDATTLSEVEVTSRKTDENVSRMAMSIQTLDRITIKKIPALMGEVDVIKTIQLLPGVQAASEGSSGFSVRGGGTDENLILLDDAPIYNASHFLGFFSVFNNDVVKEANLFKGDIPANYGGRLSSVLDVKVKDDMPKKFSLQGGVGLVTSRLMVETPLFQQQTSLLLAGRTTYVGLVIPFLGDRVKGSDIYFNDLNAKVTQRINDNNRLFLSVYRGRDRFKMRENLGLGYGNASATLRWNHIFSKRLTSNLTLLGSKYNYDIDIQMDPYDFSLHAGSKSAQLNYDFTMLWNENHVSRWGISTGILAFNQGELDDRGGAVTQYTGITNQSGVIRKALEHALYFSHDHTFSPRFSMRYGLRLSCFQNIGEEKLYVFDSNYQMVGTIYYPQGKVFHTEIHPEPRLAAMFRINEVSSVKASYSRTFQYAQVASASTGGLPFDVWFPVSPNVKPQRCDQFAVGYFHNLLHDAVETSVEIYYKNLNNVIDFKDNALTYGNTKIDGELRFGKGRSYGIEILVRKNIGKFTGWISYTYSRSLRTIASINFGKEYRSPYDRPHNFVIVANYEITPQLSVAANWIYNTGQPVTYPYGQYTIGGATYAVYNGSRNESRYPAYHRMDLSLTWQLPHRSWKRWESELNVSVYNAYAHHNTWAVTFDQDENGVVKTERMYLFSAVPSISYQFKF